MTLLNESQQSVVAAAIAAVESKTDAELVTVVARRADNYAYIPTLWAAILALLVPLIVIATPLWLEMEEVLLAQWATFMIFALLFRIPFITLRLIPKSIKVWRASSLARREFMANNLHHTRGETGVLIFVSEAEHYVEILADRGISQYVSDQQWQVIVDQFTVQLKAGRSELGLVECIEQCGELLCEFAPATVEKNELPNHLVIL